MSQPQASGSSEGRERGDRAPTTTAVKVDLSMVNRGIWLVKVINQIIGFIKKLFKLRSSLINV